MTIRAATVAVKPGLRARLPLLFLLFAAGTLSGAVRAAGGPVAGSRVFRPHPGVVCDPVGHFCAGPAGISPWLTGRFLGEGARRTLLEMTGSGGVALTQFELSNGVWCDSRQQTCWQHGDDGRVRVSPGETGNLWQTLPAATRQ